MTTPSDHSSDDGGADRDLSAVEDAIAPNPAPDDGDPEPAADPHETGAPLTPGEPPSDEGAYDGPRGDHDAEPLPQGGVTQQGEGEPDAEPGTPATSPEGGGLAQQGGADVDDV